MPTVSSIAKQVKQPTGGFLNPKEFETIDFNDGIELKEECIHVTIVGMAVDYLTRFMFLKKYYPKKSHADCLKEAFTYSIKGYMLKTTFMGRNIIEEDRAHLRDIASLLAGITDLDTESIMCACKAVTYDVWYRNPMAAKMSKGPDDINLDLDTTFNIKTMVERSINFFEQYGPVEKVGFTFDRESFTRNVGAADGDYLTNDTMWDFKVSKTEPTKENTLQLLLYYILGLHSTKEEYKGIKKIGIFNPRLNKAYIYDMSKIDKVIIKFIEDNIFGY